MMSFPICEYTCIYNVNKIVYLARLLFYLPILTVVCHVVSSNISENSSAEFPLHMLCVLIFVSTLYKS